MEVNTTKMYLPCVGWTKSTTPSAPVTRRQGGGKRNDHYKACLPLPDRLPAQQPPRAITPASRLNGSQGDAGRYSYKTQCLPM
ncbi:unnamed protein product [Protopolystoma xenopodis]|uniref:Uncharacterized protein n=1 Tax=Protopolystoma xenopodis TaxID=117903 RepID=A0A448XIU7_9PLAT|nr:unnamed protein product [Protopolystoma xenopodis]